MTSRLEKDLHLFLASEGRLELVKLGAKPSSAPSASAAEVAALSESLQQTGDFQRRVQRLCIALLGLVLGLQTTLMIYDGAASSARTWLAVGIGMALIAILTRLRQSWIDRTLLELILSEAGDRPPDEVMRLAETIYWKLRSSNGKPDLIGALGRWFRSRKVDERPVPILLVASDPTDLARLRLGKEAREIKSRLQNAKGGNRFTFHPMFATRPIDLIEELLSRRPEIVHFAGHGTRDGTICLENDSGQMHRVTPSALSELFKELRGIRCVLLNACYSEIQAREIARHVDYVIGAQSTIPDDSAIAFAIGFYQALGSDCSIEEAYRLGRTATLLQGLPEAHTHVLIRKEESSAVAS